MMPSVNIIRIVVNTFPSLSVSWLCSEVGGHHGRFPIVSIPIVSILQVPGKMDTAHHLVSALSLLQLPSLGGATSSGQAGELSGSGGCGPTPVIANLRLQCRFPWVVLQLLTSAWQQQSLAGSLQGAVLKALESITAHHLQQPRQVSWGKLQAFW